MQKQKYNQLTTNTVYVESMDMEFELPDAAEEARINAGIAADRDTFEVHDAQFKKMRGRHAGSNKITDTYRAGNEVVEKFKASDVGWQTRINEVLKRLFSLIASHTIC